MGGWGDRSRGMEGWEWARRGRTSQSCFLTFSGMALSREWLGTCWLRRAGLGRPEGGQAEALRILGE